MHSGAFATRMLLAFREYNVKSPFNFVEFALFFCSSVQKKRSLVAALCRDDIVRARVFLKLKTIKKITIYEEGLCITSYGRGKR